MTWLRSIPLLAWLVIAGCALATIGVWLVVDGWQKAAVAAAEARLERGQGEAAAASGADAVNTLGGAHSRETASDDLTRENDDAIRKAPGADAPVDPRARDAGLAGLCKRAAYSCDPRCVQFTPARDVGAGRARGAAPGG